jgi:hypothetical protein
VWWSWPGFVPRRLRHASFDCEVRYETERACLVLIEGHEYWIPKSRSKFLDHTQARIEIEDWLWREKIVERQRKKVSRHGFD